MEANTKQLRAMVKSLKLDLWMHTWTELRGQDYYNMHKLRKRYLRFGLLGDENKVKLIVKAIMKLNGYTNKWRISESGYLSFNTWLK
ncbi:uncharacterized protein METZ01_LOCUS281088 [marine metagenome]|uniref:Uncharacterized protein n=1 Tax=marine metagenome TaxID=408172 RepID=A0A382KTX0_9ZZZZ|tara:strand:- start:274 stop:534 length:261 start_codon:yes stop_codon:yes gene_type:complete